MAEMSQSSGRTVRTAREETMFSHQLDSSVGMAARVEVQRGAAKEGLLGGDGADVLVHPPPLYNVKSEVQGEL